MQHLYSGDAGIRYTGVGSPISLDGNRNPRAGVSLELGGGETQKGGWVSGFSEIKKKIQISVVTLPPLIGHTRYYGAH